MVLEEHRPTPEEILKKIRMIDPDETRVRQGRLKIFFGYAAGVGKTYAMLEMAHQMKDMGVDVVAGYIEPHIRPATMKLVEGLECLPPLVVSYKGITLRDGKDITIIATGLLVQEAVKAAKALEAAGIDARVLDIHTIKPLDTELVLKAAQETGRIVVAEEHNVIGGLGEAVSSYLSEACPTPVTKIGVYDKFGHSGPAVDLLKEFGLSAENIEATVKEVLGK